MNPIELVDIFKSEINYERINSIGPKKLRNKEDGIQLPDLFQYKFAYSEINAKKESIVSEINNKNGTTLERVAFYKKEQNVPIQTYVNILNKITYFFNSNKDSTDMFIVVGIDGTYNNDIDMTEMLNMGFYDITNGVPIDIKSYGNENKNREIYSATDYITKNKEKFKNVIIVADRAYFSYDFIKFLIANNIKFIIRVKGEGENLNSKKVLSPSTPKYNTIINIRRHIKIVTYKNEIQKTVYSRKSKKESDKHKLKIKNDCVIVTNLLDKKTYSNEKLLELYRSRWAIEVFFKFIKSNFKFQHMKENSDIDHTKMYICELIITFIAKIIEEYYKKKYPIKKSEKGIIYSINKSNLIKGIFDVLIYDILNDELTNEKLDRFCKSYIKIIQNKEDRSFPRTSKTPFTKWYIKGYSNLTKFMRVIKCIINGKTDELDDNLKTLARKIISIDDIEYN